MPLVDAGFSESEGVSGADRLSLVGPTLFVDIGFDATYDHENPNAVPKPNATNIPALVDTGASESCIDDDLARELALPLVDQITVGGVGGSHELNVYLAQLSVPSLKNTVYGRFTGADLSGGGQSHRALIGRTFLRSVIMIYDGFRGQVTITST